MSTVEDSIKKRENELRKTVGRFQVLSNSRKIETVFVVKNLCSLMNYKEKRHRKTGKELLRQYNTTGGFSIADPLKYKGKHQGVSGVARHWQVILLHVQR